MSFPQNKSPLGITKARSFGPGLLLDDGRIDDGFELIMKIECAARHKLGQEDNNKIFNRIDPEEGARHAPP